MPEELRLAVFTGPEAGGTGFLPENCTDLILCSEQSWLTEGRRIQAADKAQSK